MPQFIAMFPSTEYSGAIKACQKIASSLSENCFHINRSRETLYYKLTDRQIHHLLKFQGIYQICCKFQECFRNVSTIFQCSLEPGLKPSFSIHISVSFCFLLLDPISCRPGILSSTFPSL